MMGRAEAPLFPLPNVLLYPDAILPLHVFEPRYVQLVEDLERDGQGHMVLALLAPGWEEGYFGQPAVYPLAGLGKVLQCRPAADAGDGRRRYNILVQGLQRVRLMEEVGGDRPYRVVRWEPVTETPLSDPVEADQLCERLREGLIEFAEGSLVLPGKASLGYIADILLVALPLDIPSKQRLFSTLDVGARARAVLEALCDVNKRRRDLRSAGRHADSAPWN